MAFAIAKRDHAREERHLSACSDCQLGEQRTPFLIDDERVEPREQAIERAACGRMRFEEFRLSRDDVTTLAGLRILQGREHELYAFENFTGVLDVGLRAAGRR